ncbi:6,7-dimethyl-8-ribityllumazine synthase [Nesterenkonia lutea]|uniref:6,7-dimethyl-8-ribityllumazine synthase n=1 Tax=Nesterenkonia lutea TaxID=272919 RepID=A0ABR9JE55_9MICC|nr:6,7-dimethyl-8-ribityllumazine synthase [Nesterenkonia lutea]MBE1524210.1 6,7-dimethyl-8-ribityllumazine synthase [Nesterenkonia lutea]
MSGTGTPQIQQDELDALRRTVEQQRLKVAVVASRWHQEVMNGLIAGSQRFFEQVGVRDVTLLRAPGSFELPVIVSHAAARFDVVVALGVVIRGGTPHFEYVCTAATQGLSQVTLSSGTPVGFGLLTCDDEAQALDRAGLQGSKEDKGFEAAHAALAAAVEIAALNR